MKTKTLPVALIAIFCCAGAFAKNLTTAESAELVQEVRDMFTAFENGDATGLIEKTHPSIYKLTGGKDAFERITKQAVDQLQAVDVKFLESELGEPTELYSAGDEEICFVPRISVMEVQGKKAKSTGFMIAIRPKDGGDWTFLDGSGLRNDAEYLWRTFPELKRDITLPPNFVELP